MTTSAYFPGSAAASAGKPAVSASKPVVKASQTAAAAPFPAYPWLTAAMRSNMSARAVRLMRADY